MWLGFVTGLITATVGLAMFGARTTPPYWYFTDWVLTVELALLGLIPLAASLLVLRTRRGAALLYLSGTLTIALCGALVFLSRIEWLEETALWAAVAAALFGVLGAFWLVAHRHNWPTVLDPARPSWQRKTAGIFTGCLMMVLIALGAFRLSIPGPMAIDCGASSPFVRPKGPDHAAFVARMVVLQGWPARLLNVSQLPFGRVQEHFWGLPFWDRKIVVVALPLRDGETYFIDGTRMSGFLTQFLPVVEIRGCNRTTLLQYAIVDLRVLRDGPPRTGVRIIGRVVHGPSASGLLGAKGIDVTITGPSVTTAAKTDALGIYDLSGLPAGAYTIVANANPPRPGWNRCHTYEDKDLKPGDVWGCQLTID